MAAPCDELVLVGDLRLHVSDWAGPVPDTPAAVLLHGFTGHGRTWDTLAERLSGRSRVLAPDARGHGQSGWAPPGAYSVEEQVADVVGLLGAFRLPAAAVVGLSMGGRTAMNLAATHPDLVERLVIVDIGPQVAAEGAARIAASVAGGDVFDDPEEAFRRAREANPIPPDDALRHRVRHNLMRLADGRWTWRYDRALRGDGPIRLPRPDVEGQWALLPRITAPTLLVRGELSDVLTAADAARMAETIPDCRLVEVAGAGHSVPLDQPGRFVDAVLPFLSD